MDEHQRGVSQQQPHVGGETMLHNKKDAHGNGILHLISMEQNSASQWCSCIFYMYVFYIVWKVTQKGVRRGRPGISAAGTSVGEGSRTGELSSTPSMLHSQSGACSQHLLNVFPIWRNTTRGKCDF